MTSFFAPSESFSWLSGLPDRDNRLYLRHWRRSPPQLRGVRVRPQKPEKTAPEKCPGEKQLEICIGTYSVFHRFRQAKFAYGDSKSVERTVSVRLCNWFLIGHFFDWLHRHHIFKTLVLSFSQTISLILPTCFWCI